MLKSFLSMAILLTWTLSSGVSYSEPNVFDRLDVDRLQANVFSTLDKVLPSVVAINDGGVIFSGVIVSEEGLVLSAGHAVTPGRTYRVYLGDGRRFFAKGLGVNERVDMAMLKIRKPERLPFAELGDSSALVRDQPCIGVSYPGMYDAERGPVIRFGYINRPITTNEGMIESTAMMEPGDSGGPLFDINGKVIGIHSNIRRTATKNYDVAIDSFRKYWDELQEPKMLSIKGWPNLPKLGFHGSIMDDRNGIVVKEIAESGLAMQSGLAIGDVLTELAGEDITSIEMFRRRLLDQVSRGVKELPVSIVRDDKQMKLKIKVTTSAQPAPESYPELRDFANVFQKLESRLDDVEFVVQSDINQKLTGVRATRIYRPGAGILITKNSRVGENPKIIMPDDSQIAASIVARDPFNDLIMLSANLPSEGGIDLRNVTGDVAEKRGTFLLTPDSNGPGTISVWGSKYFNVPRTTESIGFLGVEIRFDQETKEVLLNRVLSGGARNAGLKSGDVVIKIDDQTITQRQQVFDFLADKDPNTKIKMVVKRKDETLTKEVILGARSSDTGHVADDLIGGKSKRRDGFGLAISHDAVLQPEDCGGPLFDIKGNFLGINIARHSRTRCYAIPKSILKQFVDAH